MLDCYDDWIAPERERLQRLAVDVLERLVKAHERQREHEQALGYAERLLGLDPLNEEAYLALMRLNAVMGDRAAALRGYHTCVTALRRELEIEPGPPIRELYCATPLCERVPSASASAPSTFGRT